MSSSMPTTLDTVRRSILQQSAEAVSLPDLLVVIRFLGVLAVLTGSLSAYLWSRMEVTRLSVALDESRSALARGEVVQERLELERSLLRQPGKLAEEARIRGLTPPVAVINLQEATR